MGVCDPSGVASRRVEKTLKGGKKHNGQGGTKALVENKQEQHGLTTSGCVSSRLVAKSWKGIGDTTCLHWQDMARVACYKWE
jgi:hypothetical protein